MRHSQLDLILTKSTQRGRLFLLLSPCHCENNPPNSYIGAQTSIMDSYGVKRKDTTIGPPLRILSLDGGGVRGYSMFLILQELMHRTFVEVHGKAPRRSEIPKPCDHFDLIVGTGTGGLIAIMLGRLRLDIETCKELYVRMTRMVFETDKTIAGIPYRSTLFKATKLEDAIKECVRDHTIYKREGNDGTVEVAPSDSYGSASNPRRHSSNASVVSFSARSPAAQVSRPYYNLRGGNPNARLYDEREYRTKTAVTAMYKGSKKGADPVLLRSYDSRRERRRNTTAKYGRQGERHVLLVSHSSQYKSGSPCFTMMARATSTRHPTL